MFIGEYNHAIDEKGRISLPVKFRSNLALGCVVTRGLDGCLWIYPKDSWEELAQKIAEMPITQKNARSFARFILSGAVECEIDKAGRINLPKFLLEYGDIKQKAVLTGVFNRIEVWADDKWSGFKAQMEENSEEIAENLSEIGF